MRSEHLSDQAQNQLKNDGSSSFRLAMGDFQLLCTFFSKQGELALHIEDRASEDVFGCVYNDENLPNDFKILYENVSTFYSYISIDSQNVISYERGSNFLKIKDYIGRKIKVFNLPLGKIELSNEEILTKRVKLLTDKVVKAETERDNAVKEAQALKSINLALEHRCKSLETDLSEALKKINESRNTESRKLSPSPSQIQILKKKVNLSIPSPPQIHVPKTIDLYPPNLDLSSDGTSKDSYDSPLEAMIANKEIIKFIFTVDKSKENLRKYLFQGNVFEKTVGKFIPNQIHSATAIEGTGKYYFTVKILVANGNDITIGVMSQLYIQSANSKGCQQCIAYYGDKGLIRFQQEQIALNRLLKAEDIVTILVDLIDKKVSFFVNDCLQRVVEIPKQMINTKLYPFFEIGVKGNKIELNV